MEARLQGLVRPVQPRSGALCARPDSKRAHRLKLFAIGASWGGTHSLLAPMGITSTRRFPFPHDGPLLRISIGLEDPEELWDELGEVLKQLAS